MTYQLDELTEGSGFWVMGTAAASLGAHTLVYLDSNGQWALSDADVAAKMPVIGLTKHAISSGKKGVILLAGLIGDHTWSWTAGGGLYASTTAGSLTQTRPTGTGNIVQRIGVAINSYMIYFNPKLDSVDVEAVVHSQQYFVASDDDNLGNIPGKSITIGQTAYIPFHVPEGATEIIGVNVYVIPDATQAAADWNIATTYGKNGEAYNTHGESDSTTTFNVTQNQLFEIDAFALGMLASATEEDVGGISLTVGTSGHNVTVVMAELYYI